MMQGFNQKLAVSFFITIVLLTFSHGSWARYEPVGQSFNVQVPSGASYVEYYTLYERRPDRSTFSIIRNKVAPGTKYPRNPSIAGLYQYKVQPCTKTPYSGSITCQSSYTTLSSVEVYAKPASPNLSITLGDQLDAYISRGELYTLNWEKRTGLLNNAYSNIYVQGSGINLEKTTTGFLSGLSHGQSGTYGYQAKACNSNGRSGGELCSSVVTASVIVNNVPTIGSLPNVTEHIVGTELTKQFSVNDVDTSKANISLSVTPSSASISWTGANQATISWTPTEVSIQTINVKACDFQNRNPCTTKSFNVNVVSPPIPDDPPEISSTSTGGIGTIDEGGSFTFSATARDINGDLKFIKLCLSTNSSVCSSFFTCNINSAVQQASCNTRWYPSGTRTHYAWAEVEDEQGNEDKSGATTITIVPTNDRPTVSIATPSAGVTYNHGDTITITANARDPDGKVGRVEFFAGPSSLETVDGNCNSPTGSGQSFTYHWLADTPGIYNLSAIAYDCQQGLSSGRSTIVPITVEAITAPAVPSIKGFVENSQTVTSSSTGNYAIQLNPVSAGSRYRLYEQGNLIAQLASSNLTKAVSRSSGTYQYCASAARVVNGHYAWSARGTGSQCKTIVVERPKPLAPSFSPTSLQKTGAFILSWPSNSNTTYYKLHGTKGGVDGASNGGWQELESHTSALSYNVAANVNAIQPGLYSYQLSACNDEGCTVGQQLTINTLSPYIQKVELGCAGACLELVGMGFDAQASITLLNVADNITIDPASVSVTDMQTMQVNIDSSAVAAAEDIALKVTVTNPNSVANSLLFSTTDSRPALTDASVAVSNTGVIYATIGDQLLALDILTGESMTGWPQTLDGISKSTPAINSNNGDVYVGTLNKQLYAFNYLGDVRWKTQLRGQIAAGAVLDETPLIYQGSLDGALYALNTDGAIEWQYPVGASIAKKPVLYGNGDIYVTSVDAQTHLIRRGDLGPFALRWPFNKGSDEVQCTLDICLEFDLSAYQPKQDELKNSQLLTLGRLFFAILGRAPGERELSFWAYALLNGASKQEIVDAFLLSNVGLQRFPTTMPDSAFVSTLYARMFYGNAPTKVDDLEQAAYVALLAEGNTRADVVLKLINSLEYGSLVDNTLYQVFFYFYDFCILANDCAFEGDSDDDGISDVDEVNSGLDPLNPYDASLMAPEISVTPVNEEGEFTLSWENVDGASEYEVEQAIGSRGFASLDDYPSVNSLSLQREVGIYRYRLRSCLIAKDYSRFCSVNHSNTVEVIVGGGIEITIDYPLADTPHSSLEPLEASVSTEQEESLARISYILNSADIVISSDNQSPYRYQFGKLPPNEYTLVVIATNTRGQEIRKSVDFVVSEAGGNPEAVPLIAEISAAPDDNISDVVGLTAGQFRVDERGGASYSIPITLPKGIAGIEPQLAISYNSAAGNGSMGMGWQISGLSAISRCRQTIEQDGKNAPLSLTNEGRFCLNGQKLIAINGDVYGANGTEYRTEIESKTRVYSYGTPHPKYFTVQQEDGSTTWYGSADSNDTATQYIDVDGGDVPLAWLISSSADNMGNTISYNYDNNPVNGVSEREMVIASIDYSGNTVEFNYADHARQNISRQYVFGTSMLAAAKLDSIQVISHSGGTLNDSPTPIRSYLFKYDGLANDSFDRIEAIYECDGTLTISTENCMQPNIFDWFESQQIGTFSPADTINLIEDKIIAVNFPFDIDSNGFTDMVFVTKDGNHHKLYVAYNEGGTLTTPKMFNSYSLSSSVDARLIPVDIDGDGVLELIFNRGEGSSIDWGYVKFETPREICDFSETSPVYVNNGHPGFCNWSMVDYEIENLGFDFNETGENMVVVDVNTDAYPDIVYYHNDVMKVAINKSGIFSPAMTVSVTEYQMDNLPVDHSSSIYTLPINLPAYDFNGDGVADFVLKMRYEKPNVVDGAMMTDHYYWVAYELFKDANGVSLKPFAKIPNATTSSSDALEDKIYVSDINGDGLGDVLYRSGDSTSNWLLSYSTGVSFSVPKIVHIGSELHPANAEDIINIQYIDVTNDGRLDIVFFQKNSLNDVWYYLEQSDDNFLPAKVLLNNFIYAENRHSLLLVDWDGDGVLGASTIDYVDQVLKISNDGIINPNAVNRIHTITNGFGVATQIEYKLMTNSDVYAAPSESAADLNFGRCNYDPEYANNCAPIFNIIGPSFLVSKVTTDSAGYKDDGTSLLSGDEARLSVEYHYQNLRIQSRGRGNLGFEFISTYDPQKQVTTTTQYRQDWPYIGMPEATVSYLGERQTVSRLDEITPNLRLSYAENTLDSLWFDDDSSSTMQRPFPHIYQSEERSYRINSSDLRITEPLSITNTINNWDVALKGYPLLSSVSVSQSDAETNDIQSSLTVNEYEQETADNWWINRVTKTTVTHSQTETDDVVRISEFSYLGDGVNGAGQLAFTIVEPNGDCDEYLKTTYGYDEVGNQNTVMLTSKPGCDAEYHINRQTKISYQKQRYIEVKNNGLFDGKKVLERNALGQATKVEDTNKVWSKSQYGRFGQLYFSYNQTGDWQKVQRRLAGASGVPAIQEPYHFVEMATSATKAPTWQYFDKLGRQVANVTEDINGNKIYSYSRYDALGNNIATSMPRGGSVILIDEFSLTTYDDFDRPIQTTAVDGTAVNIGYIANQTFSSTTFDRDGGNVTQTHQNYKNAFGQTIKVIDNLGGEIEYEYDVLGNLYKVTNNTDTDTSENDAGITKNVITTKHDKLGRKVEMTDPSKGKWTYKYNALGELVSQTDAMAQTTVNTYDDIGRQTYQTLTGGRWTRWEFNQHQLLKVSHSDENGSTQKVMSYDEYGRIDSVINTLNEQEFTQHTTYDEHGRVFQQFDGSGGFRGLRYHYRNGYVHQVQEAREGVEGVYYQKNNQMDSFGNVTHISQGNGVQTYKSYDQDNGHLNNILAVRQGMTLQNADYQFDGIGNLTSRQRHSLNSNATVFINGNQHQGHVQHFAYDGLNRLTHINGIEQVAYLANGNIEWKFDALDGSKGFYCYEGASPYAVSGVRASNDCSGVQDYQYDANGNMTHGRNGNVIEYSAFDKPTRITSASGVSEFAYGVEHNRYKRVDVKDGVTTTTYYVGSIEMVSKSDSNVITYRRNVPGAIALYRNNGSNEVNYVLRDHLGSLDTLVNEDGEVLQKLYFDAWGNKEVLDPSVMSSTLQLVASPLSLAEVLDITPRGFTGHESVDHAGIIHMNGRIYDPTLGRFMQADPHIQAPKNSQSYNRYSYVLNNPLSYTDPSGFFFSKLWKKIKPFVGVIVAVVGGIVCGPACAQIGWQIAAVGAAAGAAHAAANGGNIIKGALIGAFTAGVGQYGHAYAAIAGGIASKTQGGNFGHGFWSAGLGSGIGGGSGNGIVKVITAAVVGGTISKLTGGKFKNGAISAAFAAAVTTNWGNAKSQSNGGSCSRCGVTTLGNIDDLSYDQLADLRSGLYDARADGYDSASIESAIGRINSKMSSTLGVDVFDSNELLMGLMIRNYRDSQTAVAQGFYKTAEIASYGAFGLELGAASAARWAFMSSGQKLATFNVFGEWLTMQAGANIQAAAPFYLQSSKALFPRMVVQPGAPNGSRFLFTVKNGKYVIE